MRLKVKWYRLSVQHLYRGSLLKRYQSKEVKEKYKVGGEIIISQHLSGDSMLIRYQSKDVKEENDGQCQRISS